MAEQRNCPKCDTPMDYRLGEYECPSCGHTEGGAQIKQPSGGRTTSGPGLITPPPPPPLTPGPGMPGSSFGMRGGPADSYGSGRNDSLDWEKNLFIYINVAAYGLICLGLLFSAFIVGMEMLAVMVGVLVAAAIQIAILVFILKGDQMWAKYCCMGCMGLRLLGVLFSFFAPDAALAASEIPSALEVVLQAVTILFDVWFFTILYRDVTTAQY